jgi:hypothetical protein
MNFTAAVVVMSFILLYYHLYRGSLMYATCSNLIQLTYLIGQGNWKSTSVASGSYINIWIVTHALGDSWPR